MYRNASRSCYTYASEKWGAAERSNACADRGLTGLPQNKTPSSGNSECPRPESCGRHVRTQQRPHSCTHLVCWIRMNLPHSSACLACDNRQCERAALSASRHRTGRRSAVVTYSQATCAARKIAGTTRFTNRKTVVALVTRHACTQLATVNCLIIEDSQRNKEVL